MKITLTFSFCLILSGCVTGTTWKDELSSPVDITGRVLINNDEHPATKARIIVSRYFEGDCLMCMDSLVQISELRTDEKGFFKYEAHLNGTYFIDVLLDKYECREFMTVRIKNSKPMRFYFGVDKEITNSSNSSNRCKNATAFFLN